MVKILVQIYIVFSFKKTNCKINVCVDSSIKYNRLKSDFGDFNSGSSVDFYFKEMADKFEPDTMKDKDK